MEIHLKIIGIILILLALVHVTFPKYFNWKKEFKNISLINKQIMYVHTFFIALAVFLIGYLCLTSSKKLVETELGQKMCLGLCIFWSIRLFVQFFGYSSKLWKGKLLETIIHVLFSVLFSYLAIVFFVVWNNHTV